MAKVKKFVAVLVCMAMVCTIVPCVAGAVEIVDSGTCGDNLTWTLTYDGVLTISGTGEMTEWIVSYYYSVAPWYLFCEKISSVVIEDVLTLKMIQFENTPNILNLPKQFDFSPMQNQKV